MAAIPLGESPITPVVALGVKPLATMALKVSHICVGTLPATVKASQYRGHDYAESHMVIFIPLWLAATAFGVLVSDAIAYNVLMDDDTSAEVAHDP